MAFYDKDEDSVIIVSKNNWNITDYPVDKFVPIGVVVVPGTHNVYGDGSCGVISLKNMSYKTPQEGSNKYNLYNNNDEDGVGIRWGQGDMNTIPSLHNFTQICQVTQSLGESLGDSEGNIVGQGNNVYIPSDFFSKNGYQCPHDKNVYYNKYNSNSSGAPSPYFTDDSRNPHYYQKTPPSSEDNALSDFNGRYNTQILCSLAITQEDWKTASEIINDYNNGYSPAACCCWRYHTNGTQEGDWYLPSMGELGYIVARCTKVDEAISLILNNYGSNLGIPFINNDIVSYCIYWSSSHGINSYARWINSNGYAYLQNKSTGSLVRACLRINSNGIVRD